MELQVEFTPMQKEVFDHPARFKVVAAGRRCGKSYLAAWSMIINALQANDTKSWTFYVAPTQGQARMIMWKLLLELAHPVIAKFHINNLDIELINGQTIGLRGSDRPDTMRGVSLNYVVLDEYADFKPNVWEEILRPACSDKEAPALFISTPKGRNHLYELYQYAASGVDPEWKAWHFTSYDNPHLNPAEIDAAKRSMSSWAFRQEYMASFDVKGSEMFQENWVKFIDDGPSLPGSTYIAVDLAGFEETAKDAKARKKNLDDTAIAVVTVNEQGWVVEEIISGRWTLEETAQKIFNAVREYQPLKVGIEKGIAKVAVMSPLTDLMARYGRYFNVVELTHGNNKKVDRIMWALQGRFENGLIKLRKGDWNNKFLDQLFQFPNPLVHDDLVDALAYLDQLADVIYDFDTFDFEYEETLDAYSGY